MHTCTYTHTHSRGQLGIGNRTVRGDSPDQLGASLPSVNLGTSRYAVTMAAGHEHNCAVLDNKVSHLHTCKYIHTYTYIYANSRMHTMLHAGQTLLDMQNPLQPACIHTCMHLWPSGTCENTCTSQSSKPLVLQRAFSCTYLVFIIIFIVPMVFVIILMYLLGVYNHIHRMLTGATGDDAYAVLLVQHNALLFEHATHMQNIPARTHACTQAHIWSQTQSLFYFCCNCMRSYGCSYTECIQLDAACMDFLRPLI
jgi:hypothetical protein